jgi:hypothetical protein
MGWIFLGVAAVVFAAWMYVELKNAPDDPNDRA